MQNVTIDRNKYIGGSDIPIIMGISPFKTRFNLLLEKAELQENDFQGNEYTEYGNVLEPKIREYINALTKQNFVEGKHINGDIRCHTDGESEEYILEIKTTSQVHETVEEYKIYLVQLLFYMENTNRKKGLLAVYNRPSDFDEKFDSDRLKLFYINIEDYEELLNQINKSVEQFRLDLEKIKENPFLTEEDLLPVDLTELSNKVALIENQLVAMKKLEEQSKSLKAQLKKAMEDYGQKSWETPKGIKVTLVYDTPDKEVEEEYYDEEKFIAENTELHEQYTNKLAEYKSTRKVIKKGKAGYVKVTLPKEEK